MMVTRYSARIFLIMMCIMLAVSSQSRADQPADSTDAPAKKRVQITIAKDTTRILTPLRNDGYVDYVAALNDLCSKGVTPENNAVVPLQKAIGPNSIDKSIREEYFQLLGIAELPEEGSYFIDFDDYVAKRGRKAEKKLNDQYELAMDAPWSAKKFPVVAEWLKANETPLEYVVEASHRSRYYAPLVSNSDTTPVVAILLPNLSGTRYVARALTSRAMLALKSGDVDATSADLLACHRLARLIGQGPTLIDALVSIAIDRMASRADTVLAASGKLSAEEITAYVAKLEKLPPLPDMIEKVDISERYMFLDCVAGLARSGPAALTAIEGGGSVSEFKKVMLKAIADMMVDWDEVLRMGNRWYDRMVEISRKPTREERAEAWMEFDEDLEKTMEQASDKKAMLMDLLVGKSSREIVTEKIGNMMLALLLPALSKATEAGERGVAYAEVTRVAVALAAYRADHGTYPNKLKMLVPKYISEVPCDRFADAALIYRPINKGFVLYSIGPNGKDDDGHNRHLDSPPTAPEYEESDDIVVRK